MLDLARNIYYNVTIEKIKFLNLLFDHEKKTERHLQDIVQQSEVRSSQRFVFRLIDPSRSYAIRYTK